MSSFPAGRALRALLGVTMATAVVGSAASLNAATATVGAGSAVTTPGCTTAGVDITDAYDVGGNVSGVTVSGLPAACTNGTLSLAVYNGSTFSTASGTVPSSGTLTLTVSPSVPFNAGTVVDVAVAL